MKISICITTRNRTNELASCLKAIWDSSVKPNSVIVSDDSPEVGVQQANKQLVQSFPSTKYVIGPKKGVCANRNNAVNSLEGVDFVAFIDDDICIEPNFLGLVLSRYASLQPDKRYMTILTGISKDSQGNNLLPARLNFRGYFSPCKKPETVVIHAAVFPKHFFCDEQWDENIFFGYEDAELCLRAIKLNYQIMFCNELEVFNSGYLKGTLTTSRVAYLTDYDIYIEAARLYVGIKRYGCIFPNLVKLVIFILVYFSHISIYLTTRRSLSVLPEIIRRANVVQLMSSSSFFYQI